MSGSSGQIGSGVAENGPATVTSPPGPQASIDQPGASTDTGLGNAGQGSDASNRGHSGQAPELNGPAKAGAGTQPSFDIVRVEPSGDSVVAARGAPNSEVDLLDGSTVIAHEKADANGQVAFILPSLRPGDHSLALSMTPPGGSRAVSSQSLVVSVPAQPRTAPMVALIQPNRPAAVLSGPVAGGVMASVPPSGGAGPAPTPGAPAKASTSSAALAVRSVEVETMGSFYASGRAQPDSKTRVYLNGAYVASVTADPTGVWSLRVSRGMKPGHYEVRADQLGPDGQVTARVEVPYDYPAQVAAPSGPDGAKKNTAVASSTASAAVAGANATSRSGLEDRKDAPAESPPITGDQSAQSSATGVGRMPMPQQTAAQEPAASKVPGISATPGSAKGTSVPPNAPGGPARTALNQLDGSNVAGLTSLKVVPQPAVPPVATAPSGAASKSIEALPSNTSTAGPTQANLRSVGEASRSADSPGDAARMAAAVPATPKASDQPSSPQDLAARDSSTPTVVEELVTAKVVHGDSLWRISREMFGHGIRYTQIYAANTQQIRDPRLIYPGQVFVLPQD